MLKHHPDRVEAKEREEATRISAEINAAYDLLIGRNQTKK
jgi:curved DNA-binding protein CbpA